MTGPAKSVVREAPRMPTHRERAATCAKEADRYALGGDLPLEQVWTMRATYYATMAVLDAMDAQRYPDARA